MKFFRLKATNKNRDKLDKLVDFLKDACKLNYKSYGSDYYNNFSFDYSTSVKKYKAVKDLIKGLYNKNEVKICVQ